MLYAAVAYTKSQTGQMVDLIGGLHGHLRAVFTSDAAAAMQQAHSAQSQGHERRRASHASGRRSSVGTNATDRWVERGRVSVDMRRCATGVRTWQSTHGEGTRRAVPAMCAPYVGYD